MGPAILVYVLIVSRRWQVNCQSVINIISSLLLFTIEINEVKLVKVHDVYRIIYIDIDKYLGYAA
jgi:hypothetical protein